MKRLAITAFVLVLAPAALTACGGSSTSASTACAVGSGTSGDGARLSIGFKPFAEEQLLASITQQVLDAHDFTITDTFSASDKAIGTALSSGTIDMYWQYTGTELSDYLGYSTGQFPTQLTQAYNFVQQKDAPKGICWTSDTPLDDTNGIAIKASEESTYGTTLSEFGSYLASHPNTSICILAEFRTRPDGLAGLEKTYNQSYANANYVTVGSTAEQEISSGQCAAGEVFTTDAGIQSDNLYVLQDDKNLFPPDNAGLLVRKSVLNQYPAIAALMAPVAAKLTTPVVLALDADVEIDNETVSTVAYDWLVQNHFLAG